MKDFKHTHKMHHGAHPVFGKGSARPAMQSAGMPPMMPPGGMGDIQSAGEDMASSAPGGMSGGAPSGMGADGTGGAGYKRGGKIMKKARGGEARDGMDDDDSGTLRMEKMPSGAQQYVRGKNRSEKHDILSNYAQNAIDEMKPGSDDFMDQDNKAEKLINAQKDNVDAYSNEVEQRLKKGGMAKGGNWIKDATKNKGALHRSLGVPEGQKIPMGKIKKAEKSSNPTLAKRARLAETLRGFKK